MTEGMQYNADASKATLHNLEQLGLFDKIRLLPSFDPKFADKGGFYFIYWSRNTPINRSLSRVNGTSLQRNQVGLTWYTIL